MAVAREVREGPETRAPAGPSCRRYYEIGGVTIEVLSDLPLAEAGLASKFERFEVEGPGRDTISIHHRRGLPQFKGGERGREVYRRPPWVIYSQEDSWRYFMMAPSREGPKPVCVAVFDAQYRCGDIFHAAADETHFDGGIDSLTRLTTDQILLAQIFADRSGCVLHSAAAVMEGKGLVFVGPSGAGKSTAMKILDGHAEILCDDRNIVRRWPEGFRVHGTWSHGEIARVSAAAAPLHAVLFLCQSGENRLVRLTEPLAILARLLGRLIRPLAGAAWWEKSLATVAALVREVPCYEMQFDRSGRILGDLAALAQTSPRALEEHAA